jgi:hypothetical protein
MNCLSLPAMCDALQTCLYETQTLLLSMKTETAPSMHIIVAYCDHCHHATIQQSIYTNYTTEHASQQLIITMLPIKP